MLNPLFNNLSSLRKKRNKNWFLFLLLFFSTINTNLKIFTRMVCTKMMTSASSSCSFYFSRCAVQHLSLSQLVPLFPLYFTVWHLCVCKLRFINDPGKKKERIFTAAKENLRAPSSRPDWPTVERRSKSEMQIYGDAFAWLKLLYLLTILLEALKHKQVKADRQINWEKSFPFELESAENTTM